MRGKRNMLVIYVYKLDSFARIATYSKQHLDVGGIRTCTFSWQVPSIPSLYYANEEIRLLLFFRLE